MSGEVSTSSYSSMHTAVSGDMVKNWLKSGYHWLAGPVPLHGWEHIVLGVFILTILIIVAHDKSPFRSRFADSCNCTPVSLTSSSLALDNQFGQCMSGVGQDGGKYGGCGAAEPFTAAPKPGAQDFLQNLRKQEGFLSEREPPNSWTSGNSLNDAYWQGEVAHPGDSSAGVNAESSAEGAAKAAAQGAAQAVAAVQSGAIPAAAAPAVAAQTAAASSFRAARSRFAAARGNRVTDALGAIAMG